VSEILEQVYRINEINRQRVDIAAAEFSRKLADEANGNPMRVTRHGYLYVGRSVSEGGDYVVELGDGSSNV